MTTQFNSLKAGKEIIKQQIILSLFFSIACSLNGADAAAASYALEQLPEKVMELAFLISKSPNHPDIPKEITIARENLIEAYRKSCTELQAAQQLPPEEFANLSQETRDALKVVEGQVAAMASVLFPPDPEPRKT